MVVYMLLITPLVYTSSHFKTFSESNEGFFKNYRAKTRLVCTHFNPFFMLIGKIAMKIWISIFFFEHFDLLSVLKIHKKRVNVTAISRRKKKPLQLSVLWFNPDFTQMSSTDDKSGFLCLFSEKLTLSLPYLDSAGNFAIYWR